ncbi:TonB-dependent receptor domain-containing protein [Fulvivirga lutimaris]|uniref:TonB-dependent receptor domain-containing protein n=1 Tax=Fulvivirga lutimaris TaxID=1819566 RepID=UPI0012BB4A0D|nr:TonB-dependent receptor [Fulvivirga lutimaris]MTI38965.1 hypothetical protein [Fulvivirga lutimaris]
MSFNRILFWIILLSPNLLSAQAGKIKGQVVDNMDQPIPFAHIMIIDSDSTISGIPSDIKGYFAISNLNKGHYKVVISSIGYQNLELKVELLNKTIDLKKINLISISTELDEIVIEANKELYDRRHNSVIINVDKQASSGGSALDILNNAGGISVNKQNGSLSILGKGKLAIMINDRLTQLDGEALIGLLNSMPASEIKKLEIYNNPPSKYDANGTGGLIKIITSEDKNFNGGAVSAMAGYGQGGKTGASSNFHILKNKLELSGNYSFSRNRSPEEWALDSDLEAMKVSTQSFRNPVTVSHNYILALDYSISNNTVLGGSFSGFYRNWDMIADDRVINNSAGNEVETFDIITKEVNKWNHWSGNFHIDQTLGKSHGLSFNYNYLYFDNSNPSSYETTIQNQPGKTSIDKKTPIGFDVFNLDYTGGISNNVKIEAGVKATFSNFDNSIVVSSLDGDNIFSGNNLSNAAKMDEKIYAAYSSLEFQFGTKTNLVTGLRYEYTANLLETDDADNDIKREYGNFFPSVSASHQLNNAQYLQFNYNRRINRPTFNHLGSFVIFLGPSALYSGNTRLNPAIVSKFGVEWGWNSKYINIEYLTEKDAITEFQPRITSNDQYLFKAENFDKRAALIITIGSPVQITAWWKADNSFTVQNERLKTAFEQTEIDRSLNSFRISSSHRFSLGSSTTFELSGNYRSPSLFGISTFESAGSLNVGFQQTLKGNMGVLKLSYSNILASDNWKIKTEDQLLDINTFETYLPESGIVSLTYTKTFGNSKKTKKNNAHNAEEEKNRVK